MDENNITILQQVWVLGRHTGKFNACSWTQSDRFFILTELGVEIFILVPQPNSKEKEFYFKRSFIPHGSDEYKEAVSPYELYDADSLLHRLLEREKSLPFISKDGQKQDSIDDRILYAAWAPNSLLPTLSPALAVLSVSGRLTVHSTDRIKEYPAINVTEIFSSDDRENKLTASMAWFETKDLDSNGNKHFLICGQHSGSIKLIEASVANPVELQFTLIREIVNLDSRPTIISSISGNKTLIIIGTINGKLYGASPDKNELILTLWPHEDNIQINTITSIDYENMTYIFITKQTHLILFKIDDGKLLSEPEILKTVTLPFVAATKMHNTIFFQTSGSDIFYVEKDIVKTLRWPSDLWRYQAAKGLCFSPSGAIGAAFATSTCSHKKKVGHFSSNLILFHLPISFITMKCSPEQEWDKLELRRILLHHNRHSNDQLDCLIDKTFTNLQLKLWTEQNSNQEVDSILENILENHLIGLLKTALEHSKWDVEYKELIRQQYRFVLSCKQSKSENIKILKRIEKKLGQMAQKPARQCLWCDENFDGILCSKKHPRQWCFISLKDILSDGLSCPFCHATADINVRPVPKLCIFCNTRLVQMRFLSNET